MQQLQSTQLCPFCGRLKLNHNVSYPVYSILNRVWYDNTKQPIATIVHVKGKMENNEGKLYYYLVNTILFLLKMYFIKSKFKKINSLTLCLYIRLVLSLAFTLQEICYVN